MSYLATQTVRGHWMKILHRGLQNWFFQFTSFSKLDFLFQSISRVSPFTYVFPHDSTYNGRPLLGLHFHPAVEVPTFVSCNLRLQHNIFKQTMAVNWRNFSCVLLFFIAEDLKLGTAPIPFFAIIILKK